MTVFVHTLIDAQPPARADGEPWEEVRIEESATQNGTYATTDTQILSPLDADPSDPQSRDITFSSLMAAGWFRLVFIDGDTEESIPTEPVYDDGSGTGAGVHPSLEEVGALLRARTKDTNGAELGTFTADTRPTANDAATLVFMAVQDVTARVGTPCSSRGTDIARSAAALRAAMLIELSYFPEQVRNDKSPYKEYKELYESTVNNAARAIQEDCSGEEIGASDDAYDAQYEFPDANNFTGGVW